MRGEDAAAQLLRAVTQTKYRRMDHHATQGVRLRLRRLTVEPAAVLVVLDHCSRLQYPAARSPAGHVSVWSVVPPAVSGILSRPTMCGRPSGEQA